MLNHVLQPDTQAILLLCASFGQKRQTQPQPLTLGEYNFVAGWLQENQMRPADLLTEQGKKQLEKLPENKLELERLFALIERGVMLSLAVEKWTNQGLWILGRSDSLYPKRLKQRLKHSAPPILYGVGNVELLSQGGLAIVGSREVDEDGIQYTRRVAQACATNQMQVVSGGARGVDLAAMLAALEAGGTATGVLADSLSKAAVQNHYRPGIKEGKLTLVSAYDPDASFSVGNAMGRNRYIYSLSDYALAVTCSFGSGGTWTGAVDALERIKDVPIFVWMHPNAPEGNLQLLKMGAKSFPPEPWDNQLQVVLSTLKSETQEPVETEASSVSNGDRSIYEAVLPIILQHLQQPKSIKSLAESLNLRQSQLQDWLDIALSEGQVRKINKPIAYVANQEPTQLSLLEGIV